MSGNFRHLLIQYRALRHVIVQRHRIATTIPPTGVCNAAKFGKKKSDWVFATQQGVP
jgi:hypothetical protein